MGRRPKGDRAMSGAGRQRQYLARLKRVDAGPAFQSVNLTRVAEQSALVLPLTDPRGPVVRLEHLARWPRDIAPFLHQRLGVDAVDALINALVAAKPEP